jgi:Helix-turn-helix domain
VSTPALLFTSVETCDALRVSRKTLYSWTWPRGPIRSVRIGSVVRYSVDELKRFIAEQQAASNTEGQA